jgi:hypothetical protein
LLAAGANGISEPRLHRGAAALRRGQCTECPHQLIAVWECRRDRQRRPPRHDMQRLLHQIQIAPATRPRASALRLASRWRASAGDGLRRYRKAGVQHSGGDHLCLLFRLDCGTRRQTFFCPGRVRVADPAMQDSAIQAFLSCGERGQYFSCPGRVRVADAAMRGSPPLHLYGHRCFKGHRTTSSL